MCGCRVLQAVLAVGSVTSFVVPALGQCQVSEVAKLTASDAAPRDSFGSVAVSGNVAVVGASNQGNPGNNLGFGKAYVFEFNGADWDEVAQLTPSDPQVDQEFGNGAAIDGDTIVVAAPQDNGGLNGSGALYVYEKPPGGWHNMTETAKLTASDAAPGDILGLSPGISGDTIVAGAPNDDDAGSHSGSAYVFEKPVGGWGSVPSPIHETAKLTASDAQAGDRLGRGAAIDGDTIVVGTENNPTPGAAYVFEKQAGGWVQTAKLTASDGAASDQFGTDVAVHNNTIAVGAFQDDDGGNDSGSAYVFEVPDGGWSSAPFPNHETAKLTASDPAANDMLGFSVAFDNDGTLVVGTLADGAVGNPGAAYIYARPVTGWTDATESCKLTASDGVEGDRFGQSVAVENGTVIVGAPLANGIAGVAYVFSVDLNESPVCDSGGPYTGECEGEATAISLDGGGSSDPDDDPLTFLWTTDCLGEGFDDETSDMPILTVDTAPGCDVNCNVTLTVDDGNGGIDSCSTTVTITDTQPPVVTCPDDVTVTCGEPSGPGALGSATTTDTCDTAPAISADDAVTPGSCSGDPVQETIERTWTATDACENSSSCVQTITVDKVVLHLDIKPESCPNAFNPRDSGYIPVALLGTPEFDVATVDLASVRLSRGDCVGGSLPPARIAFEDAATPFAGEPCDCHQLGGDGIVDLLLKFKAALLVDVLQLGDMEPDTSLELVITGNLLDGGEFIATDCLTRRAVGLGPR